MRDKDFDNYIKDAFEKEAEALNSYEDIFERAWNNKNVIKVPLKIKKLAAAVISCVVILGGLVTFSPDVRANVLTFFGVDSEGNIVEKSPEDLTSVSGNWGNVTEADKAEVEDILKFKLDFPEKAGEYDLVGINPLITIEGIKIKDSDEIVDKVFRNEDEKENFKNYRELAQTHNTKLGAFLFYQPHGDLNEDNGFCVSVSRIRDRKHKDDDMEHIYIEGIDCAIEDTTGFKYVSKMIDEFSGVSDMTKEPELTDVNYIVWSYGEFDYMLHIDKGISQEDIMNFLKTYIKKLKER